MEPLPALVRTSALNTRLFPKLTAFASLTQNPPFYFLCTCQEDTVAEKLEKKRDGDEDVAWPINLSPSSFSGKMKPPLFLVAGGPLRVCEEEFMGAGRKLIVTTKCCGVSICLCLELLRGKHVKPFIFYFRKKRKYLVLQYAVIRLEWNI